MFKRVFGAISAILTVVSLITMLLPSPGVLFPDETEVPVPPNSEEVPLGTKLPIQLAAMPVLPLKDPGSIKPSEIKDEISRAWDIIEQGLGRTREGRDTLAKLQQSVNRYHNRLIQTIYGKSANSGKAVKSVYTLVYTLAQKFGRVGKGMIFIVPLNSCELAAQMGAEVPLSCSPQSLNMN